MESSGLGTNIEVWLSPCESYPPLCAENKFAVGSGAKTVCVCYFEEDNNW